MLHRLLLLLLLLLLVFRSGTMADAASVAAAAIASGSAGNVSKSIIPVRPDGLPIVALRMSDVTMRVTPEGIWEIRALGGDWGWCLLR